MPTPSAPSFYGSPQEALQGPPEEFLYLACLHEGTGVESPDFLAVVDADSGQIVHETPMPNVGDASTTSAGTAVAPPATDRIGRT